jgi:GNAT superfamily N-acetyltransferase
MEGPRAAKLEDLPNVLKLINSTFPPRGCFAFRMESKFPLFLSEGNLDNIRVFCDQSRPVSVCSYYPCRINVYGCSIRAASIGAVCTEPSYRGQGLSSRLLDDIEEKAVQEGIDLLLISGTRGLYLRRKCAIVGGFVRYDITPSAEAYPFVLDDFSPAGLQEMEQLYNREPVRYERTRVEFDTLVQAGTMPDYNFTYKLYQTRKNGQLTSYIVFRIVHAEPGWGEIVEYAGDRADVAQAVRQIAYQNGLPIVRLQAHVSDPLRAWIDEPCIPDLQEGTVKILRPAALLASMRPYFAQYSLRHSGLDFQVSEEQAGVLSLQLGKESLSIADPLLQSWLIFGFPEDARTQEEQFFSSLSTQPGLKACFTRVFPIPFPYAGNLNYV